MKRVVVVIALMAFNLWGDESSFVNKTHRVMKKAQYPPALEAPIAMVSEPKPEGPKTDSLSRKIETISWVRALFSPDDDVQAALLEYIKNETKQIQVAIFLCTDKAIAQALVDAKKCGVAVEVIIDHGCSSERAISLLCEGDCLVYIYDPSKVNPNQKSNTPSLMHNKFILFSNNKGEKLVWTGSYNFTKAAQKSNQENVTITQDEKMFQDYSNQFKKLQERSRPYCQKSKL